MPQLVFSIVSVEEDENEKMESREEPQRQHSRGSSASSTLTSGTVDSDRGLSSPSLPVDLGDYTQVGGRVRYFGFVWFRFVLMFFSYGIDC